MSELTLATIIFVVAFVLIASDRVNITVVALLGAAAMMVLGILEEQEAFFSPEFGIDHTVIYLLIGLMLVVNVLERTGVFEWLSIKAVKLAKGYPFRMLILLSMVTAVVSAFLNNITTVMLVAPVAVMVARALKVDAIPFLISLALASNIGGTATLIGDPPNMMIASKASLNFMDFIYNLAPVVIVVMVAFLASVRLIWGRSMTVAPELRQKVMAMDESGTITNPRLLYQSLVVLALMLFGFFFPDLHHLPPATVALAGGTVLLFLARDNTEELLRDIDWQTIFFFVGLFIIVGGVAKAGLISVFAEKVMDMTQGSMLATSMVVLWSSAIVSAFVNNIPFIATMNPMIIDIAKNSYPQATDLVSQLHQPGLMPVWWALALGGCLGGNGTLVGASANIVAAQIGNKNGFPVSFKRFTLYGFPLMIESIIISMAYVYVRYFFFGGG